MIVSDSGSFEFCEFTGD